jgi:predicted metal-dependent enzyme (double-stranded beta helix superfamily)
LVLNVNRFTETFHSRIEEDRVELPVAVSDRTLTEDELRSLVARLAEDETLWRSLVHFDDGHRGYRQLLRTDHVDVWVLSWRKGDDTGFHDHDVSAAAIAVVEGAVVEERMVFGGPPVRHDLSAGDVLSLDATCIHRMYSKSDETAITIHAYSPVPQRNGSYVVSADGTLHRRAQNADEELSPFLAA